MPTYDAPRATGSTCSSSFPLGGLLPGRSYTRGYLTSWLLVQARAGAVPFALAGYPRFFGLHPICPRLPRRLRFLATLLTVRTLFGPEALNKLV